MIYDRFLGDTNCIHVVMFSLSDTYDEQIAQVFFWFNFLKARVTPLLPLGRFYFVVCFSSLCFLVENGLLFSTGKNLKSQNFSHIKLSLKIILLMNY